jgi:hypothetical protein
MMAKALRYLGPADNLWPKGEGEGKPVHPGDEVSLSNEVLAGLVRAGHRFENVDVSANNDLRTAAITLDNKVIQTGEVNVPLTPSTGEPQSTTTTSGGGEGKS